MGFPPLKRDRVVTEKREKIVMLNLVQHLKESDHYETLKQVQGDRIRITSQFSWGEGRDNLVRKKILTERRVMR